MPPDKETINGLGSSPRAKNDRKRREKKQVGDAGRIGPFQISLKHRRAVEETTC